LEQFSNRGADLISAIFASVPRDMGGLYNGEVGVYNRRPAGPD
jgi:hypothetical protein